MKQKPRIYCTESQKALMWERWKQGGSMRMKSFYFATNQSRLENLEHRNSGGFWKEPLNKHMQLASGRYAANLTDNIDILPAF